MNTCHSPPAKRSWFQYYPPGIDPYGNYPPVTIADIFENTVARYPEHRFLTFAGKTTDYAHTNVLVKKLAIEFIRLGVRSGDRIAFQLPNCPQEPISFLAATSIGATAVPFEPDPLLPADALAPKIKDSGATIMICLDLFYPGIKDARILLGTGDPLRHIIVASVSEFLPPVSSSLYSVGYPLKVKLAQWEAAAERRLCKDEQCVLTVKKEEEKLEQRLALFERAQKELRKDLHENHETLHCFYEIIHKKVEKSEWKILDEYRPMPDTRATIFYTSGTTGSTANGAELSHDNLICNVKQAAALADIPRGTEVFGGILPFSHALPNTVAFLLCMERAGELVLAPDPRDFKAVKSALVDGECSVWVVVPKLLDIFAKKMVSEDFRRVKYVICGGAPLPDETGKAIEKLAPGKLRTGYGTTECSPIVSCDSADADFVRSGSVGIPVPGTDVKIMLDENGAFTEAQEGELGRIWVKGRQVFHGYWNAPEKTSQVLTKDGWFITSDIGWMNEGYLYIKGRADDTVILPNGEKVYPADVEAVIEKHPAVKKVAVAGIPVPGGKEVVAFVVLKKEDAISEKEIMEFAKTHLSRHNIPKEIYFRTELPELAKGQVLRRVLIKEEVEKRRKK